MDLSFDHCLSEPGVTVDDVALLMEDDNSLIPTTEELSAAVNINPIFHNGLSAPAFCSAAAPDLKFPSVAEASDGFNLGAGTSEILAGHETHFNQYTGGTNNCNLVVTGQCVVGSGSTGPLPSVLFQYPHKRFQQHQQHCIPHKLESCTMLGPEKLWDEQETQAIMRPLSNPNVEGKFIFPEKIYPCHGRNYHNQHVHLVDSVDLSRGGKFSTLADTKCSRGFRLASAEDNENPCVSATTKNPKSRDSTRTSGSASDHVLGERKRRERINQRILALSAVIPGLKMLNKATVLDDAVKYVKQLQERLALLEQARAPNKNVEPVVHVNRYSLSTEDDKIPGEENCTGEKGDGPVRMSTPEIEIRVVDEKFLVRIHCEKRKGLLVKSVAELEKLRLTVVDASILSFTDTEITLTLNGQMEEGCSLSVTDIAKALFGLFKRMT